MSTVSCGALLRLTAQDRAGLSWLRDPSRRWMAALRTRRKHRPRCTTLPQPEIALLQAVVHLRAAADVLLDIADGAREERALQRAVHAVDGGYTT